MYQKYVNSQGHSGVRVMVLNATFNNISEENS